MKINEVETLVGMTKKNIRFYEEQGLIAPRRNAENGYREYDDAEVQRLRRIKLFRKLGIPIDEIRHMLDGTRTVGDGMRRHLIGLERERKNLTQSIRLCTELQDCDAAANELDPSPMLARMDELERGGVRFRNRQTQDVRVRYVAPVVITLLIVALMAGFAGLLLWGYRVSPDEAPPLWFLLIAFGAVLAVAVGAVLALLQRIREIIKGEIDDAKRY